MEKFNELSESIQNEILKKLELHFDLVDSRRIGLTSIGDNDYLIYEDVNFRKGVQRVMKRYLFDLYVSNPNTEFESVNIHKIK